MTLAVLDQELADRFANLWKLKDAAIRLLDQTYSKSPTELLEERRKKYGELSEQYRSIINYQLEQRTHLESLKKELQNTCALANMKANVLKHELWILRSCVPGALQRIPEQVQCQTSPAEGFFSTSHIINYIKKDRTWKTNRQLFSALAIAGCITRKTTIDFLTMIDNEWDALSDFGLELMREAPNLFTDPRCTITDEVQKLAHFRSHIPNTEQIAETSKVTIRTRILNYTGPENIGSSFQNPFLPECTYTTQEMACALEVIFNSFLGLYNLTNAMQWLYIMKYKDPFNMCENAGEGLRRAFGQCLKKYLDEDDYKNLEKCCLRFVDIMEKIIESHNIWTREKIPIIAKNKEPFKSAFEVLKAKNPELCKKIYDLGGHEAVDLDKFTKGVQENQHINAMPAAVSLVTPVEREWGSTVHENVDFTRIWTVARQHVLFTEYQRPVGDGQIEADLLRTLLIIIFSEN